MKFYNVTDLYITQHMFSNNILSVKWVFIYKFDKNGDIIGYKARLVIRGDL